MGMSAISGRAPVLTGGRPDLFWAWITLALSALVIVGYVAIAFNWYFQRKVSSPNARAALLRLLLISTACAMCGGALYWADLGWGYFRLCDAGLALLAAYTWWFVLRMRGVSLVDERLAQLAELEERAERYREIAELLPHLVWTASREGHVDFSNQRWFEYAGVRRAWPEAVHAEDRERVGRWWDEALAHRRGGTVEARLRGKGGAYRTFLISATPILHGSEVKWLGACADIEDQKQLAAAKEEQARRKAFFLNALSHDLRSPLNVVALHAEMLQSLAPRDTEIVESAKAITESAAAAAELIARLLDFAKVGSLERNVVERVSVATVLEQIYRRYHPVAERNGLYLRTCGDLKIELNTDLYKVERIVGNLVENAIKYTRQGGVTVTAAQDGDAVVLQVRDTGIGIPQEKTTSLFDEFYQVGNAERDRKKGFGLGLAICRSLAEQIGAEVRLVSTGPAGSCFEFRVEEGVSPVQRAVRVLTEVSTRA
jgi:PAS domain S-box-containing protein